MYLGVGLCAWGRGLVAVRPVAEHRGWKRIRSMEYLGYERGYLWVRGWLMRDGKRDEFDFILGSYKKLLMTDHQKR